MIKTTPDIMEKARELAKDAHHLFIVCGLPVEETLDIFAAALAEARAVPQGYALVPLEPARNQLAEVENKFPCLENHWLDYWTGIYKAMLAASPNPPIAGGEG